MKLGLTWQTRKAAVKIVFTVQGASVERVAELKYLVRILFNNDADEPKVNRNLKRARTT